MDLVAIFCIALMKMKGEFGPIPATLVITVQTYRFMTKALLVMTSQAKACIAAPELALVSFRCKSSKPTTAIITVTRVKLLMMIITVIKT